MIACGGAVTQESTKRTSPFLEGVRDGIPIALGYFAVAFSLGIAARNAGLDAWQAFVASAMNLASAGEYAGFSAIAANASYFEVAFVTLVTNARYFLMGASLAQRFDPNESTLNRIGVGYGITDEIFGIAIARPAPLVPAYSYGAIAISMPSWATGTALGVIAGNALPANVVAALSVSLFGMFLAIIMPEARKSRVVLVCVIAGFVSSYVFGVLVPLTTAWTPGTRTIILTIVIAGIAAVVAPVGDDNRPAGEEANDAR